MVTFLVKIVFSSPFLEKMFAHVDVNGRQKVYSLLSLLTSMHACTFHHVISPIKRYSNHVNFRRSWLVHVTGGKKAKEISEAEKVLKKRFS